MFFLVFPFQILLDDPFLAFYLDIYCSWLDTGLASTVVVRSGQPTHTTYIRFYIYRLLIMSMSFGISRMSEYEFGKLVLEIEMVQLN